MIYFSKFSVGDEVLVKTLPKSGTRKITDVFCDETKREFTYFINESQRKEKELKLVKKQKYIKIKVRPFYTTPYN